ncbi:MAG: hypothetical protein WAW80_02890 [Candidatus Saccharimonadales bacterium]
MSDIEDNEKRHPINSGQIHGNMVFPAEPIVRPPRPVAHSDIAESIEKSVPTEIDDSIVSQSHDLPSKNTPGLLILQWLTYAFWGWTALSFMWLLWLVIGSFFDNYDTTSVLPYAIASVVVLLPLSFVCDLFYSRKEPIKKTGGATVVMIIHAVIFALFSIGLLIGTVFLIVNLGLNGFTTFDSMRTPLLSLSVSVVLYAMTFLRTLNPNLKLPIAKIYRIVMVAFIGLIIIFAFIGPAARSVATRDDRLIVANIDSVNQAVSDFTQKNHNLPTSLSEVNVKGDAKLLIEKGLVRYKAEGKATSVDLYNISDRVNDEYHFQLCVTFKEESSDYTDDYNTKDYSTGEYQDYLSTIFHPAGEICYKLKVTDEREAQAGISMDTKIE